MTITKNVTDIGVDAFYNNVFVNITIPDIMINIGFDAFGWANGYSDENIIWQSYFNKKLKYKFSVFSYC